MSTPTPNNTMPKAQGPYSLARKAYTENGNLLFVSGQLGVDPATGSLVTDSIEAETHQLMQNMNRVLRSQNMTLNNVVKTSVYTTDMSLFSRINEVYGSFFTNGPARETVGVASLPLGARVEISAVASSLY